jgi:hypothetical protein
VSALRLTWVATHTGNVVSGIATLLKPAFNDQLLLTYAVPADSIQGFPRCEIAGPGNATATNSDMTGTLPLMFTSCAGTGLEPPGSNDLRLTK